MGGGCDYRALEDTEDREDEGQGNASFITQTDANGMPLSSAANSLLHETRRIDDAALLRSRERQLMNMRSRYHSGLCYRLTSLCLNICCCIAEEDTSTYYNPVTGELTLLPPQDPDTSGKKCLVLDLDETLVHSSFKPVPNPDYIIPVTIEGTTHRVYVVKRPGVDLFLERLGELYEIVVFTASLSKYADPLLDMLDVSHVIKARLFRDSCSCFQGNYVKDLALLGRELKDVIIVDNSPASYLFHPENAIGVSTFIDDTEDREQFYCASFLESIVDVDDVRKTLHTYPDFIAQQIKLKNSNTKTNNDAQDESNV